MDKKPTMNGQLMFATLAMHFNLKEKYKSLNDEVRKEILEWMDKDPGVVKSNMGGWHSRPTHKGKLKKLTNIIATDFAPIYAKALGWKMEKRKFFSEGGAWANVNPPGGSNNTHVHGNCVLSAVYYVETHGAEQGPIIFCDPRPGAVQYHPLIGEPNYMNAQNIELMPQDNDLLLFPAWLPHRVAINKSEKNRISVAVNFNVGIVKK
jgi:uncharacterized protein (TIGR02466 family)